MGFNEFLVGFYLGFFCIFSVFGLLRLLKIFCDGVAKTSSNFLNITVVLWKPSINLLKSLKNQQNTIKNLPAHTVNFHVKPLLSWLATVCSIILTLNSQTKSIKSQTKPIK
jgi:hypothetical protein